MPSLGFGVQLLARSAGDPATTPSPSHKLLLEDGIRIEQLGFDAVWVPDHYYFERPWGIDTFPDVWTLLTAIAVKTEKVRLGTNVLSATFRHPGILAKMAGALQELADGRLILGIGAGNQVHENTAFGHNFERRIGAFKEYLPILTGLLKGETVTAEGRYFQLRNASLRTFVPHVPVWVASGGPQMFELTARYAEGWNMAGGGTDPGATREKYEGFAAACRAVGKDPKEVDVCKQTFVGVAPDEATKKRMIEELAAKHKTTPAGLAERVLVDTPDGVAARLRDFTQVGVNHHIFALAASDEWPNLQDAFELLAREVVPLARA
jgi:alkanesulfonate monooxygenase SsuD/methylene tetrahydromethanopterin reductase-like flavin-dependent oxidoreductase (luciferase family)